MSDDPLMDDPWLAANALRVALGKAEAEVEKLREEREDSLSRWNQIAESEAEVERLRAALKNVGGRYCTCAIDAHNALAEEKE